MDTSIKALIHIWLVFLGMVLLLSCLSFFIAYNNSTSVLYATIQDIEIYGYDKARIEKIQQETNTVIIVAPVNDEVGKQYNVQVGFYHIFAFVKKDGLFYVSSKTRVFEY